MRKKWRWVVGFIVAVAGCQSVEGEAGAAQAELGADACSAEPTVVVAGLATTPATLRVDDRYVYFVDQGYPQTLWRVEKTGALFPSAIAVVSFGGAFTSVSFEVDAAHIYTPFTTVDEVTTRIAVLSKNGLVERYVPAIVGNGCSAPAQINEFARAPDGTLYWLQRGGCATDTIVSLAPDAPTGQAVYSVPDGEDASDLLVDASHLFWLGGRIGHETPGIFRLPRTGGSREVLLRVGPAAIAIDANNFYFSTQTGADQRTFALTSPGQAIQILSVAFRQMTTDGGFIYGTTFGTMGSVVQDLQRFKPNGHGFLFLGRAASTTRPVVDETSVYFVDPTRTKIMSVCK